MSNEYEYGYEYGYEYMDSEEVVEELAVPEYHNLLNQHIYEKMNTKSAVVGQMPVGEVSGEKIDDYWLQVEDGYIQLKYIKEV